MDPTSISIQARRHDGPNETRSSVAKSSHSRTVCACSGRSIGMPWAFYRINAADVGLDPRRVQFVGTL